MTALVGLREIAESSATHLLGCLVEGTLVALFAGLALRISRRQTSGTKFAVWFSALMVIAALPVLGAIVWSRGSALTSHDSVRPVLVLPGSWAVYLFTAWFLIALFLLVRVAIGLRHLQALRKSCTAIDRNQLDAQLRETLDRNPGARAVSLTTSERVQVPTAIGLIDPIVVIPQWAMNELPADELNQILLHELAHLRRWDDWTNLAQQVVIALFFFHPAVWWIEKKVSLEREMACDDAVLAETGSPRAYASCLTHLAEKTFVRRSLALAQAVIGRMRQTSLRVARILDTNPPRSTKHAWAPAALLAGLAVACASIAAREPALIAFHDVHPEASIASADSSISPALKPIPAAFHPAQFQESSGVKPSQMAAHARKAHIALAKHDNPDAPKPQLERLATASVVEQTIIAPNLIHFASASTDAVISTETVFVFVEAGPNDDSSHPVCQIRVWQLTFHPPVLPVSKPIPNKET